VRSPFVDQALKRTAKCCGLTFVNYDSERGLQLQFDRGEDPRITEFLRPFSCKADTFWVTGNAEEHALRCVCRLKVLANISPNRLDSEEFEKIDIEASSQKVWKTYVKSLSFSDKSKLNIWRSGAIWTPTRRYHDGEAPRCIWCDAQWPSARHFIVECRRFQADRAAINTEFGIPAVWWGKQPRVTTKSGWITLKGGATVVRRATLQVAVAKLASKVIEEIGSEKKADDAEAWKLRSRR
jgi:hypothetical protein